HRAQARHHRHEEGIARRSGHVGVGAVSIVEYRESAAVLNTLGKRDIVRRVPTGLKFQVASRERCESDAECGYPDQHQRYRLTPRHYKAPPTAARLTFKPLESPVRNLSTTARRSRMKFSAENFSACRLRCSKRLARNAGRLSTAQIFSTASSSSR